MTEDPSVIRYDAYGDESRGHHLEVRKHGQVVLRVSDFFGDRYEARVLTDMDLDELYDHATDVVEFEEVQEFAVESQHDGAVMLQDHEYEDAKQESWSELDERAGLRGSIDGVDIQGEYRGATIKTLMDRRYIVFSSAHDTEDVMREVHNGDYLPSEIDRQELEGQVEEALPDSDPGVASTDGPGR